MTRLRSLFAAVILALLGGLLMAPDALAVDVRKEGSRTVPIYLNGDSRQGAFTVAAAVEVYYSADQITRVRAFGMATRGARAAKVQINRVDLVDLTGTWRTAGVPRSTGSGTSVKSYTGWAPAAFSTGSNCTRGSVAQVRLSYIAWWANGAVTRGSVQSFVSYSEFCRR